MVLCEKMIVVPGRRRTAAALALSWLVGCGGGASGPPAAPSMPSPSPSPSLAPPLPGGGTSGRIADAQAAADIITYNQDAASGSSFRRLSVISRWELPVPVFVDSSILRTNVEQALQYWQSLTGITFVLRDDATPRVLVRAGTDGLPGVTGRAVLDGVFSDNRARSALVVIHPELATCNYAEARCYLVFRHELGHALGMLDHVAGGGIMSGGLTTSAREVSMLGALYRLPHGARVAPDGTWETTVSIQIRHGGPRWQRGRDPSRTAH